MKEFEWYRIRNDDKKYEIGEICELSHNWWQDDPKDGSKYINALGLWDGGELDGTCAINCTDDLDNLSKIVEFVKRTYPATYCYLIGSDVCYGGNDANEIIMVDAEVLKEF